MLIRARKVLSHYLVCPEQPAGIDKATSWERGEGGRGGGGGGEEGGEEGLGRGGGGGADPPPWEVWRPGKSGDAPPSLLLFFFLSFFSPT